MGVYIPGLDMPENCSECRFGILSGDRDWCTVSLKYRSHEAAGYIPNDCPLVEVKTPHGKLCDAYAARECLEESEDNEIKEYALMFLEWAIDKRTVIEAEE